MGKKISKTPITDTQISEIISMGLTPRITGNLVKKYKYYEDIIKKVPGKLEDLQARQYLQQRLGKDMKMPKLKITKDKNFKLINEDQEFHYEFPMLPSNNHMYMTVRGKSRQLTNPAKVLFLKLQDEIIKEAAKGIWQPTQGTLLIAEMKFYMDSNRIKDNHNMFKFLFDVMEGILYDNDYYILPQVLDLQICKSSPRIEFKLKIKK